MVAKRPWQIRPPDLWHYSPNVIRASSSLRRFCSAAFDEVANRSASSKNARFSRSRASEASLDQIDDDAVRARAFAARKSLDPTRDARRQADALNDFF
jgi:hypothetical protein